MELKACKIVSEISFQLFLLQITKKRPIQKERQIMVYEKNI